tara:strand:- start:78 stop:647 length:570 start_codon:yes stop_codon:yes gene_type:complete
MELAPIFIPYLEKEMVDQTVKSIRDLGIENEIHIIDGRVPPELNIPRSKLCSWVFKNRILPLTTGAFFYTEEGVKWIKNPIDDFKGDTTDRVIHIGWTKELRDFKLGVRSHAYIVGSKLVYFPKKVSINLKDNGFKLQHLDRMIMRLNPIRGEWTFASNKMTKIPKILYFRLFKKNSNFKTQHNIDLYE